MAVKKQICPLCGTEISVSNFSKHMRRHDAHPESFKPNKYALTHDGLDCQFCGKSWKTRSSLCNHERQCKLNPNRQQSVGFAEYNAKRAANFVSSWNAGLTKETDSRLAARGKKLSDKYASGELVHAWLGRHHSDETKAKLRAIAINNQLGGHPYRKQVEYNGVLLDSSLELMLAVKLDELGIDWTRCERFTYIDPDGKIHTYTPDFYLPEYNIYLDPKNDFLIKSVNPALGFKDCDKIRWAAEQNGITIYILSKQDIERFDINFYKHT